MECSFMLGTLGYILIGKLLSADQVSRFKIQDQIYLLQIQNINRRSKNKHDKLLHIQHSKKASAKVLYIQNIQITLEYDMKYKMSYHEIIAEEKNHDYKKQETSRSNGLSLFISHYTRIQSEKNDYSHVFYLVEMGENGIFQLKYTKIREMSLHNCFSNFGFLVFIS